MEGRGKAAALLQAFIIPTEVNDYRASVAHANTMQTTPGFNLKSEKLNPNFTFTGLIFRSFHD